MGKPGPISLLLIMILVCGTLGEAQKVRYFKAEHGVAATYVKLGADGRYRVIDREHMGIFLTDEGRWQQMGAVITFSPGDPKNPPYLATENQYKGNVFLAHLPDHVLFKITAEAYSTETKETYPFRYIGKQPR